MRLKIEEINQIKNTINEYFDNAKIYIFGSRLDDSKKGGDIDIFIISKNVESLMKKKAKVRFLLEETLCKPVDILVHRDFSREIEVEALKGEVI